MIQRNLSDWLCANLFLIIEGTSPLVDFQNTPSYGGSIHPNLNIEIHDDILVLNLERLLVA
jgi:hypothetical protein